MYVMKKILATLAFLLVLQPFYGCGFKVFKEVQTNEALSEEKKRDADELHRKGLMLYDEKRYFEAIDAWLKEIEIAPFRVKPYNNIGITYRKLNSYESALRYHEKALGIDPLFGHTHYSIGLVYYDLKDYTKAREHFIKSVDAGYYNSDVYYSLGQAHKELKEYEEAILAYEEVIRLYYNYPGGHYQLGDTFRLVGKFDLARMELKREISINPGWKYLCDIALLELATQEDPSDINAFFSLGMTYRTGFMDGYLEKSAHAFKKVIELNPAHPNAHFLLGELYEKLADISMSMEEYEKEMEINPYHTVAAEALAELKKVKESEVYIRSRKEGNILYLKLKSGNYVVLADSEDCEYSPNTCNVYHFIDHITERGFYIVEVGYYEGGEYLMISDKTGEKDQIHDLPNISPDRRRFVTVPKDEAYGVTGVFIWRFEDSEIISEFFFVPKEYAFFEFIGWEDNDTILLKKLMYANKEFCPEGRMMTAPVTFKLDNSGWRFIENLNNDTVKCEPDAEEE